MELALLVYGISLLESVNKVLLIGSIVLGIIAVISTIVYAIWVSELSGDEPGVLKYKTELSNRQKAIIDTSVLWKKFTKTTLVGFVVALVLNIVTPNERTAWIMVGAFATQQVATTIYSSDRAKQLGDKTLKIIEAKVDELLVEGKKDEKAATNPK